MEKDNKKLSKLVPGKDYVWGIYNKNHADSHTDRYSITDYALVRGEILKNEKVERKIYKRILWICWVLERTSRKEKKQK